MRNQPSLPKLLPLVVALLLAGSLRADRTEWSESSDRRTKTVYDDQGNILYQAHWDRHTGKLLGEPLDRRPAGRPVRPPPPLPKGREPAGHDRPEVRFEERGDAVYLVADSLVRIRFETELHSGRSRRGDRFRYTLLDPVEHGGRMLLAAGTRGSGQVMSARKRGMFGKSGRMQLDFGSVRLASGARVRLMVNRKSEEANRQTAIAAGTSGAGLLILGPIGLAGGAFIKGRDVHIQEGRVSWVAVAEDVLVEAGGDEAR